MILVKWLNLLKFLDICPYCLFNADLPQCFSNLLSWLSCSLRHIITLLRFKQEEFVTIQIFERHFEVKKGVIFKIWFNSLLSRICKSPILWFYQGLRMNANESPLVQRPMCPSPGSVLPPSVEKPCCGRFFAAGIWSALLPR